MIESYQKGCILNYSNLYELIKLWVPHAPQILLRDISIDSREVNKGDLFIAIDGYYQDGRNYISEAIYKNVAAVIAEKKDQISRDIDFITINNIPVIYIDRLKERLSILSKQFYCNPSNGMCIVGVTGTNGKTTVTNVLSQWVRLLGETSAVMGTLGNGIIENMIPSTNTTASAVETQRILLQMKKQDVRFVAMEVSSHGIVQHRVSSLYFSAAVFTNLTYEHLDYHGDMKKYAATKWRLFGTNELNTNYRVINIDDPIGKTWIQVLPKELSVAVGNTVVSKLYNHWLCIKKVDYHFYGTDILFHSSWGNGLIHSQFIGKCNVYNLSLSLATLLVLNYPLSDLLSVAQYLKPICGRMEFFRSLKYPLVLVDYAHNPNALKNLLIEARMYCLGKIWCIFGCGGNRDKVKRSIMGAIAEKYSDKVIITDDNPRNEESMDIINDIMTGIVKKDIIKIIPNRKKAITYAITHANLKDLIIVAGKGHEKYQIFSEKRLKFSDRLVISKLIR